MHAVVVNLTINEPNADLQALRGRVVPLISQARVRYRLLDTEGQCGAINDCVRFGTYGQRRG